MECKSRSVDSRSNRLLFLHCSRFSVFALFPFTVLTPFLISDHTAQLISSTSSLWVICLLCITVLFLFLSFFSPLQQHHPCSSLHLLPLSPVSCLCHCSCVFCPMFSSSSLPSKLFPLCLMEVEPYEGTARRRPVSLCPCWSPEGNVTLPLPVAGVAGYRGNHMDLHFWDLP